MTPAMPMSTAGPHLILRGDASSTIGTGHLMRMLALAQAWIDGGGRVELLVAEAPEGILDRFAREGVAIVRIVAAGPDPADAGTFIDRLGAEPGARGVLDGPGFDLAYLERLGDVADRVLVIDDMALLERYPVGLVLNQNAHAERSAYPVDDGPTYLLGLAYNLLRREFRGPAPARPVPVQAKRLLTTFGGADPAEMTARSLAAIGGLPATVRAGLEVEVIVGAANATRTDHAALAKAIGGSVRVEHDVTDMVDRLAWADLTVTSGGTTVWELARIGGPALVVETTPPERLLALGLERVGLFDRLGPAADLRESTLTAAIARRLDDVDWRREMARLGPSLVDGGGSARVAAALAGSGAP